MVVLDYILNFEVKTADLRSPYFVEQGLKDDCCSQSYNDLTGMVTLKMKR